jgi:hypothetical protein
MEWLAAPPDSMSLNDWHASAAQTSGCFRKSGILNAVEDVRFQYSRTPRSHPKHFIGFTV